MLIQSWVRPPLDSKLRGSYSIRLKLLVLPARSTFFKNFQGLTNGQTNLTQNKLDSMESMVIKTIWLGQLLTNGSIETFGGYAQQTLSIIVGNQTVVKNLPIQFNQGQNGQAFDRLHENGGSLQ
jgi:hypothetical protein